MKPLNNDVLIQKAQGGDELALETLIKDNEGLIYSIINRFKYYDKDDLYQVGMIGLILAIKKYDPSFETQFSTYAFPVILGEVKRYMRDNNTVKISRDLKTLFYKIEQAREFLSLQFNREATLTEIAHYLEVGIEKILEAMEANQVVVSLDTPLTDSDGKDINLYDYLEDFSNKHWFEKLAIREEIEKLNNMEKMIIHMRYKLDYNQEDVAKRLGISQVQVSRIERKIINNLRSKFNVD